MHLIAQEVTDPVVSEVGFIKPGGQGGDISKKYLESVINNGSIL